jgi:hypothetical protein
MDEPADGFELLVKPGGGKLRGMGGPVVRAMRGKGQQVSKLFVIFGE